MGSNVGAWVKVMTTDPIQRQRDYYRENAEGYDAGWSKVWMEQILPFPLLIGLIDVLGIQSLLDVGSGNGRALRTIRHLRPDLKMVGIDPSEAMRQSAYRAGLAEDQVVDGDATKLQFADNSFDLVCEFGSLHHMANPALAVEEMCRVASKVVYISDCNNFGEGSSKARLSKQVLNALGMWKWADFVKTRGKGYRESVGDGISYSYSVFTDLPLLERLCRSVHTFNINGTARSPFRGASRVVVVGILTDEIAGLPDRI